MSFTNNEILSFIENESVKNNLCHIVYAIEMDSVNEDLKVATEYKGRVVKVSSGNFHLGARYENMAQNKERDFNANPLQKSKGMHVYDKCPRYVRESDTIPNYLYLVMPLSSITHFTTEYFLDGVNVTFDDLVKCGAFIEKKHRKGYVKKLKTEEKPNYYKVIKFENIVELKQTDLSI